MQPGASWPAAPALSSSELALTARSCLSSFSVLFSVSFSVSFCFFSFFFFSFFLCISLSTAGQGPDARPHTPPSDMALKSRGVERRRRANGQGGERGNTAAMTAAEEAVAAAATAAATAMSVRAEHALQLSEDMKRARAEENRLKEEQSITFTLADDNGTKITALRAIVAARAFGGQLLESDDVHDTLAGAGSVWSDNTLGQGGGKSELVLKGVKEAQLLLAIDYMYTGYAAVDKDNVYDLLGVSAKLQIPGLTALCSVFLKAQDDPSTICKVLKEASENQAEDLKKHCFSVIDRDTKAVVESPGFMDLPLEVVIELLQRDTLNIDELALFKAVIKWGIVWTRDEAQAEKASAGAADTEQAADASAPDAVASTQNATLGKTLSKASDQIRKRLESVIECVRFPLIAPDDLQSVVQPELEEETGKGKYVAEALILEGYQHHALVKIGQVRGTHANPPKHYIMRIVSVALPRVLHAHTCTRARPWYVFCRVLGGGVVARPRLPPDGHPHQTTPPPPHTHPRPPHAHVGTHTAQASKVNEIKTRKRTGSVNIAPTDGGGNSELEVCAKVSGLFCALCRSLLR